MAPRVSHPGSGRSAAPAASARPVAGHTASPRGRADHLRPAGRARGTSVARSARPVRIARFLRIARLAGLALPAHLILAVTPVLAEDTPWAYPETPRGATVDTVHGVAVPDPYGWLEDGADSTVLAWDAAQNRLARAWLDTLPQPPRIRARLEELLRYDDESTPEPVPESARIFYTVKRKDREKRELWWRETPDSPGRLLLDPNAWGADDELEGTWASRDGRYLAFGRARGGNEDARISVLEVDTGRLLPDSLRGWRQGGVSWLPGNRGFYYAANPRAGEVPPGEEHYWSTAWLHLLGQPAAADRKVFASDTEKDLWHGVSVSEDGRWAFYWRSRFNANEVLFGPAGGEEPPRPLVTGMDGEYRVEALGDRFLISTDRDAPLGKVWAADPARPEREFWREFLAEHPTDRLSYLAAIAGHLYAVYLHDAHTRIDILDVEGTRLRELRLPVLGTAWVSGMFNQPEAWINFSSYTWPYTTWRYDFERDSLAVYRKYPVPVRTEDFLTEQVWYSSKDGTRIPMFIVRPKDRPLDGTAPLLLTGYGGFDVSTHPLFSPKALVWLEAGGIYAAPCLRGGGEYGRSWHEAGMREKKQNVFDDFIAAAEWLVAQRYTDPGRLTIWGGSNGGLLTGAAVVQRPDLFRAAVVSMPLLDMVRFHKFGYAGIWREEYGSAEDPSQFPYLLRYSPYHNVRGDVRYPAVLLLGAQNDARVDPLHARKMAARLQAAGGGGGPILLMVRPAEGHLGGAGITKSIEDGVDTYGFLMGAVGLGSEGGKE